MCTVLCYEVSLGAITAGLSDQQRRIWAYGLLSGCGGGGAEIDFQTKGYSPSAMYQLRPLAILWSYGRLQ